MEKKIGYSTRQAGTYVQFEPQEKKAIITRLQKPYAPISGRKNSELKTQEFGKYLVASQTQHGELAYAPLDVLRKFMANEGCRHLGRDYYQMKGGYAIAIGDGQFEELTNFVGRILVKEIEVSANGDREEKYLVLLQDDSGDRYQLRVPATEWGSLLEAIERTHPRCQLFSDKVPKARDCFKRIAGYWLKETFPTRVVCAFWGWGPLQENHARTFYHGGREDCKSQKILPQIMHPGQVAPIVAMGTNYVLAAGPLNVTVPLLLYSLASYTDAIFTDAGFPLAHCMMLIGGSGFLKSSFSKEIFSPFVPYNRRTFTVRSTEASMNVLHEIAYDDTLVIDDFNLEGSPAEIRHKMRNIRGLIRGYSDKTPRAKYGGMDNLKQYAMRGGCVFTAETAMTGQLKSGELRYVKITLHVPFDKSVVAALHAHPDVIPTFFAEYIRFLEVNYLSFLQYVQTNFPLRRAELDILEPRMKDAAIHLGFVADFLMMLLVNLRVYEDDDAANKVQEFKEIIIHIAQKQSVEAQIGEPHLRYIEEVLNLIGTGNLKIASSPHEYIHNLSRFIGYREGDLLVVKKDELYSSVMNSFYARNEGLPISVDEVSKKLKEEGLTKCDRDSCLLKASSKIPGRPRMLAMIISACFKKLSEGKVNGNA